MIAHRRHGKRGDLQHSAAQVSTQASEPETGVEVLLQDLGIRSREARQVAGLRAGGGLEGTGTHLQAGW